MSDPKNVRPTSPNRGLMIGVLVAVVAGCLLLCLILGGTVLATMALPRLFSTATRVPPTAAPATAVPTKPRPVNTATLEPTLEPPTAEPGPGVLYQDDFSDQNR